MIRGPAVALGRRILIVEGITPGCHMLAERLGRRGYEVEMARSAREALLLAKTGRWDAVVLNIGLPGMNGVELYTGLHPDGDRECLPIIFVSGYAEQNLLQALRKVPRGSEPVKAFGVCHFLSTLEQYLQNGKFRASTQP
jgi:two-component system KDP operon response regulator KdpE